MPKRRPSQHPPNLLLVLVLLQARIEMVPPLKEHRVADELEPRCELEAWVLKLLLELFGRDVLGCLDLVRAGLQIDIGLDEENVVNWDTLASRSGKRYAWRRTLVHAPFPVARGLVVDPSKEVEVANGNLLRLYP